MTRSSRSASIVLAAVALVAAGALAQRRPPATESRPTPAPAPASDVVATPVTAVDGMLRRMRVWLFAPPAGATAFGLEAMGPGRRVWALLPSCRAASPDDINDPCPVDHVSVDALGGGSVRAGDPRPLGTEASARRVQTFVVPSDVARVRIRLLGAGNRVRYEAVVESERLTDLPHPEGQPTASAFAFDLTRYPAR